MSLPNPPPPPPQPAQPTFAAAAPADNGTSSIPDELEHYLHEKQVSDVFIRIVEKMLMDKPDNVYAYIVGHILDHYPEQTSAFTRRDAGLPAPPPLRTSGGGADNAATARPLDESTVSADDDFVVQAPAQPVAAGIVQSRRGSISAAPLSAEEVARPPEVFYKTPEDAVRIDGMLKEAWVTSSLNQDEAKRIVDAMERVEFAPGQVIIHQGDTQAEHYFVVDRGTAEVTEGDHLVRVCRQGDSFGELALLYNTPRCATVTAGKEACTCWRLGRVTFKSLVINAAVQRRDRYKAFLSSVPLLSELDAKDRNVLADTLQTVAYSAGAVVVAQGGKGDAMFLVVSGKLQASDEQTVLAELGPGDYFGELALLNADAARSCTVTAVDACELLRVRREVFLRVLAPVLGDTLRKHAAAYKQPVKQTAGGSAGKKKKKRAQAALDSTA